MHRIGYQMKISLKIKAARSISESRAREGVGVTLNSRENESCRDTLSLVNIVQGHSKKWE
jgi:thymidine phosphorylase